MSACALCSQETDSGIARLNPEGADHSLRWVNCKRCGGYLMKPGFKASERDRSRYQRRVRETCPPSDFDSAARIEIHGPWPFFYLRPRTVDLEGDALDASEVADGSTSSGRSTAIGDAAVSLAGQRRRNVRYHHPKPASFAANDAWVELTPVEGWDLMKEDPVTHSTRIKFTYEIAPR